MVKSIFTVLTLMSVAYQAEARNCIKYPRRCAKDVDKKRRQLTEAVVDVATLGYTQRQEEKQKAEKAEALARQQRDHARQVNLQAIDASRIELARLNEARQLASETMNTFSFLAKGTQNTLKLITVILEDAQIEKVKLSQIRQLVVEQNSELLQLLSKHNVSSNSEVKKQIANVQSKLNGYKSQLASFPISELNDEALYAFTMDLLEESHEVLAVTQASLKSLEFYTKQIDSEIKEVEAKIEKLSKLTEGA